MAFIEHDRPQPPSIVKLVQIHLEADTDRFIRRDQHQRVADPLGDVLIPDSTFGSKSPASSHRVLFQRDQRNDQYNRAGARQSPL